MRLYLTAALTALLAFSPALAQFSTGSFGASPGFTIAKRSTSSGYTGPGDLSINSSVVAWVGARCYSSTYSGNAFTVSNTISGKTTTVNCSSGTLGVVAGNDSLATLEANCATAGNCNLTTIYDQSSKNSCTLAACSATAAPAGSVGVLAQAGCPAFTVAVRFCFSIGNSSNLNSASNLTSIAQPLSLYIVAYKVANTNDAHVLAINNTAVPWLGFLANTGFFYNSSAGNSLTGGTGGNGAWFSIAAADNGTSTSYLQGNNQSPITGTLAAITYTASSIEYAAGVASGDTVYFEEEGVYSADIHTSFGAVYSNASGYLGGF